MGHLCFISAERDIMIDFHNISKSLKNITATGELVTEYYNHSDENIIAKDIFINQSELFVPNVTNINNLSIAIVPPINYPRQLLKYVQTYQFPSILWDTIFIILAMSLSEAATRLLWRDMHYTLSRRTILDFISAAEA